METKGTKVNGAIYCTMLYGVWNFQDTFIHVLTKVLFYFICIFMPHALTTENHELFTLIHTVQKSVDKPAHLP